MKWRIALCVLLWPALAHAADEDDGITPHPATATGVAPEPKVEPVPFTFRRPSGWKDYGAKVDIDGYVLPQFELVSSSTALPRDKTQYGAKGTRAGFILYGSPWQGFTYVAHFVAAPLGVDNVSLLSTSASTSNPFSILISNASATQIDFEEASLGYRPVDWFQLKAGVMRLPFTIAQSTPNPEQMFPFRPPISGEVQSGPDAAVLGGFRLFDAKLLINTSVFLGNSITAANQTLRGVALLGTVAAQPFGEMSLREGDESRGPFRASFGVGTIYRHVTSFDTTGYEASKYDDVRFSASARASYKGLYVQAEYLRRNRTNDLSGRPDKANGAYAEASFFQPIKKFGLSPQLRVSTIETGADFKPRRFKSFEGGLAFYPHADQEEPEKLRILFEYYLAQVTPLKETQHEGLVQVQLEF